MTSIDGSVTRTSREQSRTTIVIVLSAVPALVKAQIVTSILSLNCVVMVLSASRLKVSVVLSKVNQLWKLASVVVIEY